MQIKNTDIIRTVIGFWECTSCLVKNVGVVYIYAPFFFHQVRWMKTSKVRIIFIRFYYSTLSYILVLLTSLFCASMACSINRNAAVYGVYTLNWQRYSLLCTLFFLFYVLSNKQFWIVFLNIILILKKNTRVLLDNSQEAYMSYYIERI